MARFVGLVILVFTTTVPQAFAQVDLSGVWGQRQHEDQQERGPGGELGDYLGIPLNDAARLRDDSWDAALYGLAVWQCRPHGADVMWRSVHPLRATTDIDPSANTTTELCEIEEETDHPKGWVPHRLPGTTTDAEEFAKKHNLPVDAVRGGAETMYPEYRKKLKTAAAQPGAQAAASQSARPAQAAAVADVRVLKIRDNLYMLSGAGGNTVVQTFAQGVTVVDTGLTQNAD